MITRARVSAKTCTAQAILIGASVRAFSKYSVRFGVFVALRTVLLFSLIFSGIAALNVFSSGDRFQMVRVNAASHPAQMIQLEFFRDWPNKTGVRYDVYATKPRGLKAADLNATIPIAVRCSHPNPTAGLRYYFDVGQQSFNCRSRPGSFCHGSILTDLRRFAA